MSRRVGRIVLLLALAVAAASLASFFDSSDSGVVFLAFVAWGCLLVAIAKVR
ncbi:MAG: hypothetical protein LBV60_11930 [Streptomyces sp.]|jgi:hypothetical protein|nr:hypothetical protein [Streptomyces sp.]